MSAEVFEPWVTTAEVAAHLGKRLSWVYDNGHLMPRYKIGAHYRYRLSEVDRWVESQGATSQAPAEPAPLALVADQ